MCLSPEVRMRLAECSAALDDDRRLLARWADGEDDPPDEDVWGACSMTEDEHRQVAGRLFLADFTTIRQ